MDIDKDNREEMSETDMGSDLVDMDYMDCIMDYIQIGQAGVTNI